MRKPDRQVNMKITRALFPFLIVAALTGTLGSARAANTDGTVTYSMTTQTYSGSYAPKSVSAVWVVDGNGVFVKTLCRHAVTRIQYLLKWIASRGTYTVVDGVTSATLTTQPQTHAVTWDCRGTNGLIVADGTYTIRAEYTSNNGQGPYLSTVCSFVKGTAAVSTNYPDYSNASGQFTGMTLTYSPKADIGISALGPSGGIINSNVTITVTATNLTINPATFSVAVSNLNSGTLIGTLPVTALPGNARTNLAFNWSTAGLAANPYQISAVASKLTTETNTANNAFTGTVTLSAPTANNIAVVSLTPAVGLANASVSVTVLVTNDVANATPAFNVALSNVTAGATLIATRAISALGGYAGTNVIFAWNTAALPAGTYQLKASAGPLTNETNVANNWLTAPIILRDILHDVAISSFSVAAMIPPNVITNVTVAVTNRGDVSETFTNALRDVTAAPILVGTRVVTNLAAYAVTNVIFAWNTATNAGFKAGFHTLEAGTGPVPGETNLVNNTNQITVIVANGVTTNALVAMNAVWKYTDKGLDITAAPWQSADYYDGFWSSGAAPLGYTLPNIATAIGYGGVSSNRYTTTYFRREFTLDLPPLSLTGRLMRAHGVILYLNGTEIARQNMPPGPVTYASLASNTVSGAAATNYFGFVVPPAAIAVGRNLLTAELHLSAATNTTAGFALELTSVNPTVPSSPSVSATSVQPDGTVLSGDSLGVQITLVNTGNAATSCLVLLRDATTGAVLASQTVNTLAVGESTLVRLTWPTFGATTGARTLQAVTVINGVTNLAGAVSAPATVDAPNFAARSVNAAASIGGRCNAVAVAGRYVYLGCGATLEAWDVIVPTAPVRMGSVRLPGTIEDLAASNNWVYAATGVAGVQIVDASSPTQLVHRATFDTSGFARRITLNGTLLYIADGISGIRVLNVSSPATPTLAGAYQTTGPAQTVTFASPRLLVLDGQSGLQNLNAANPAAMTVTGTLSRVTAGLALAPVSGDAIVADANARLYRISLASPAAPTVSTNALLPAAGRSMAASSSGAALFVAAGAAGLLTLNATTLALTSILSLGGEASDVAVAGNTLYVASGFAGCRSLDVTSPLSPTPIATFATGARAVDAAASGSTLYLAADESGLQTHSLQNLSQPGLLATVASVSNSRCVEVSYPLAYVGDGLYGLKIFNIANAAAPTLIGSYPATGLSHIRRIARSGTRAVLTDGRTLQLLSVANPYAPALLATATNTPGSFIFDMVAVSNELYAACGNAGLRIYGLNTGLALDSTYVTPGPATGVTSVSNLLQVACGPNGWLTLSIAVNPVNPVLVKANNTGVAFAAASAGPLLYLTDGVRAGKALNVSAPLTPTSVTNFPNLTQALRVRAVSGLILAAEDEAGLTILNASPSDINLSGIPDTWEQQIANSSIATNGPIRSVLDVNPQALGPNGFSYYQSFLAGLSPTDPRSVLAITAATTLPTGGGLFVIQWKSTPGIKYVVYKSTNLTAGAAGFAPLSPVITATANLTSYTNTVSSAKAFYMVITTQ